MEEFLINVKKIAYDEAEKTGMPIKLHVDLAMQAGERLAKELGANTNIVVAGTLLMDCMIGQSIIENRQNEHILLSLEKANELLFESSLSEEEKENIRHCILEHHGVDKFYSLESEICCNADCYRFISIKGFIYAVRYLRAMPFEDLVSLLNMKVEEKWNLVTLGFVKDELNNQYHTIKEMISNLK